MPPVNITWSVEKPVPSGGKNFRFVILRQEWLKRVLACPDTHMTWQIHLL